MGKCSRSGWAFRCKKGSLAHKPGCQLSFPISEPCRSAPVPVRATCAAASETPRERRIGTTTTTVAPVPSDTPEPSPSSFKHSLISLKREGWWGEAGLRIASLPSSEQQRVPLVGKRLPSDTAAVVGELQQNLHCWEVTTVGKGGSCGDNGGHATPRSRYVCSKGICHRYHLSVGRFLSGDIFSVRLISV